MRDSLARNGPDEILKHAPQVISGGAALAGALKFTDIVKAMLGPATEEVAERIKDEVRLYRLGRQLEALKKAEAMARKAGFKPSAISLKLLFPLLEGASFEENDALHTMWAALLANSSNPETSESMRPSFANTLRNLAPSEALLLSRLHDIAKSAVHQIPLHVTDVKLDLYKLNEIQVAAGEESLWTDYGRNEAAFKRLWLSLDTLLAERLLEFKYSNDEGESLQFTSRGDEFVTLCRAPNPGHSLISSMPK